MAETALNILVHVEGAQASATQIKSVGGAVQGVGKQTEETSKHTSGLKTALSGIASGFLAYKAASWIKGAVNETIELGRSTHSLTQITGLDARTAAGWVETAKERGVESKALNMGFISLARNTENLAKGSKTAVEGFNKLGISQQQWAHMGAEQRMLLLADRFKQMKDPAERAALAQQLFGRTAKFMIPLLAQGSDGLRKQIKETGAATGENAKSVKEQLKLVQAQRELNQATLQLKVAVATALIPIMKSLAQTLGPIIKSFASLMQRSGLFRAVVLVLTAALVTMVATIWLANTGLFTLSATILIIPAAIVAAIAVFVILYQKVGWFHNAVKAVWDWIKANWPLLASILLGPIAIAVLEIIKHWKEVKQIGEDVFNAIKKVVEEVAKVIANVFVGAFKAVKKVVEEVIHTIGGIIHAAKEVASLPGKAFHAVSGLFGQTGLYMSTPGMAIVGEHGPEMVHLPGGAQVHPFVQSYGGGGSGPIVVHSHVYLDKRQIGYAMGAYVADRQAAR